jgi:hypothetical protein
LPDVVLLWFVAMLVLDSQGKNRIFGIVAMSIALCFELYSHILRFGGTSDTGSLKLLRGCADRRVVNVSNNGEEAI